MCKKVPGTHKVRNSASQVVLRRMRLTLQTTRRTRHGAWCLVHAISAWSVNSQVLRPDVVGMRGSIPYGLRTTAMHEMSTHRPSFSLHAFAFSPPYRILTPDTLDDPKYDKAVKMYEVSHGNTYYAILRRVA